jgi:hypothetical protein
MLSKAVVIVVISFLLVILIAGATSTSIVFAKINKTVTTCTKNKSSKYANAYTCCYSTTNTQTLVSHDYCADCFAQSGGFACGDYVQTFRKGQPTGVLAPLGPNAPPNIGTPPPVSIIKVPPGTFNPGGNSTGGVIKVPPLIPTNPNNNTGGTPPPPTGLAGPGCGPGTDNSTCSTSTPNPTQSTQNGGNLGSSTSNGSNAIGSQITTNKGNSPTPPPCPKEGPIPPNCTLKPVIK